MNVYFHVINGNFFYISLIKKKKKRVYIYLTYLHFKSIKFERKLYILFLNLSAKNVGEHEINVHSIKTRNTH